MVEYADQMVGSGPKDKAERLQTLQDRAIRIIDNNEHRELNKPALSAYYRITPLNERRAEHLCVVMHRLSKNDHLLDISRPEIHLRNHNKVKFKTHNRINEKYLKSPILRGVTMWDRIPESIQSSLYLCFVYNISLDVCLLLKRNQ